MLKVTHTIVIKKGEGEESNPGKITIPKIRANGSKITIPNSKHYVEDLRIRVTLGSVGPLKAADTQASMPLYSN